MDEINFQEIKKYFKQLRLMLSMPNMAEFRFLKSSLYKKNKIDDICCCIEASLPKAFFDYKLITHGIKSPQTYKNLKSMLQSPFFLNHNLYIINTVDALEILDNLSNTLYKDIERANELM